MNPSEELVIALDAESGDHGAGVLLPAAADVLESMPGVRVLAAGREAVLRPQLDKLPAASRKA